MNMSYCRFENTNKDFGDCLEAMRDLPGDRLSESELSSAISLARKAQRYLETLAEAMGMDWEDFDAERHATQAFDALMKEDDDL